MENPDAGWSFKDAVGKSLPSSFFSYKRSNNSSSAAPPLPTTQQSTFAFRREHRFSAIHERRQLAVTRGYTDGLATAQIFAANALSKLGFIDQYIDDSIKALGAAIIPPNMEQQYRTEFMRGLREGEDGVRATMAS
jgi:glucan 1,3-beta-glucosidase